MRAPGPTRAWFQAALLAAVAGLASPWFPRLAAQATAPDPIVTIWYRGTPAGTPRAEELAGIRALGFGGVTWPAEQPRPVEGLKKLAADVGLQVSVAPRPVTPSAAGLLEARERVDLVVTRQTTPMLPALAWRAVAHGARIIGFDAGEFSGTGLENADRSLRPWTRVAIDVARQFSANRRLIQSLKAGPGVIVTPESGPALDVVLLDADRSWVLVATNASAAPVSATVRLPAGAPYAIWVNLFDNAPLAMNGEAAGPRWSLRLAAGEARFYLIDKTMK
jgi:hypothetical protein